MTFQRTCITRGEIVTRKTHEPNGHWFLMAIIFAAACSLGSLNATTALHPGRIYFLRDFLSGGGPDATSAIQTALNTLPAGSVLDLGDASDQFTVGSMVTRTSGGIEIRGAATITYTGAMEIEAVIKISDCDDVIFSGPFTIDAGGNARHAILIQTVTKNIQNIRVDKVKVKNTKIDPNLWYGGVTVYASGGQASSYRPKNVVISAITALDCGTHGALTAYCDNVIFKDNYIKGCLNHGYEAVHCTNVSIKGNVVDSAGLSGLGVGTNVNGFEITGNMVKNCAGDGSLTVEHNSVNGSVHHNFVQDCKTSGINVSFGSPSSFPFDTLRNISVHHNAVFQKDGVSGYAGCNVYASPSAKGFGVHVDNNSFVDFDRGIDYSYSDHGSCSNNQMMFSSGTMLFVTRGTFVKNVSFSGNSTPNTTSDHAFQICSDSTNQSSFCEIIGNYANQCGTSSNKCLVYIDGSQFGFEVSGNATSGAYSYLYCSATPSVVLTANKGPLSSNPYVGVGVPVVCANNENHSMDFLRVGTSKEVASSAIPIAGNWQAGDRCRRVPAVIGQPKGWICTTGGSPGIWVSEGTLWSSAP